MAARNRGGRGGFVRSATDRGAPFGPSRHQFEEMARDLALHYPDVPVPKSIWRWIDAAQHALVRAGAIRAFSLVDLLICGIAAQNGLMVLHDDRDFETAAQHLNDVRQRRV
jgi:predicted nucleic acid-binding protein